MRRFNTTLIAGAMLLATIGVAGASSHSISSEGLSFIGAALWEIEHFTIHLSLTFQALMLCFISPALGWGMLADQTLCASVTPVVGLFFGSALGAIATFVLTIVAIAALFAWFALTVRRSVVRILLRQASPMAA